MNFPDFNTWHKVPKGATIPAGTPFWRYDPKGGAGRYLGRGVGYGAGPEERWPDDDYFTEEPIPDPDESATWARAERMHSAVCPSLDDAWDWNSGDAKYRWYDLAKKYVEKED